MTVRETLLAAAGKISGGVPGDFNDTPYLDAMVLLAEVMNTTKEKLYASYGDQVPPEQAAAYREVIALRKAGTPVSYIRGRKEFYGREFAVDDRVLVPRPDTEIMIDTAMELITTIDGPSPPLRLLDLCTGSGCIAVTIAAECGERGIPLSVAASDISPDAEAVFKYNSRSLLGAELPFYLGDLFDALPRDAAADRGFDLICTNPPYLTGADMAKFREIHWPEPEIALYGGMEGLEIIARLIKKSVEYLSRNGYLLLEAAPVQFGSITSMMEYAGFSEIDIKKDLGNRERVIVGKCENGREDR